jgi:soluble lytic murein transglycosylase-like protein
MIKKLIIPVALLASVCFASPIREGSVVSYDVTYRQETVVSKALSYYNITDEQYKQRLENAIIAASDEYNVDPLLIVAIIKRESEFNFLSRGRSGEIGLMQIMPFWAIQFSIHPKELYLIESNIKHGAQILSLYMQQYESHKGSDGRIWLALRAYNSKNSKGSRYANDVHKEFRFLVKNFS